MLSIIACQRGKYYTVLTEEELLDYNNRPKSNDMRLLWRGSLRELQCFAKEVPPDLFTDKEPDEDTSNHDSR